MSDHEWIFPDELQCFNPDGTKFEEIFKDSVALIAYAQYRRKHIVSKEENEWLPRFAKIFSVEIQALKDKHSKNTLGFTDRVNLEDVVKIWDKWWCENPRGFASDETAEKWRAMLEPILPFLNGEKTLILVKKKVPINANGVWEDRWFLTVERLK
jgi:hypothetical protein